MSNAIDLTPEYMKGPLTPRQRESEHEYGASGNGG